MQNTLLSRRDDAELSWACRSRNSNAMQDRYSCTTVRQCARFITKRVPRQPARINYWAPRSSWLPELFTIRYDPDTSRYGFFPTVTWAKKSQPYPRATDGSAEREVVLEYHFRGLTRIIDDNPDNYPKTDDSVYAVDLPALESSAGWR